MGARSVRVGVRGFGRGSNLINVAFIQLWRGPFLSGSNFLGVNFRIQECASS